MVCSIRSQKTKLVSRALMWTGIGLLALKLISIIVFRVRWQPAIDAIRRFNREYLNPQMMRFAGREHWYASVVRHKGRKSGRDYETPVWAIQAGGHFYIPLPYGEEVDWCRNILEAGSCIVEHHGRQYEPIDPVIVSAERAAEELPLRDRLRFATFGVDSYLRLDVSGVRLERAG